MKKYILSTSFIFTIFLILPLFFINIKIQAAEIKTGDTLRITEYIDDDLYASGSIVEVNEDISGDIVASGGKIIINDDIYGHAILAGGTIVINGDIHGSLFATGGQITVNGDIGEDANIAGGMIALNGKIKDDVRIATGNILVKSETIGGDVFISAGGGNISQETEISGDKEIEIGSTAKSKTQTDDPLTKFRQKGLTGIILLCLRKAGVLIGWIIVGALLLKFVPGKSRSIIDTLTDKNSSIKSLAIGLVFTLSLIIVIPLLILLTIFGIGQALSQVFLAIMGLLVTVAGIYSSTGITKMILKQIKAPKSNSSLTSMIIGVSLYQIIGWLPYMYCCLSPIVKMLITIWGLGGIFLTYWNKSMKKHP